VRAGALALAALALLLLARAAAAADPAAFHTQLGLALSAKGLHRETLAEFERAFALDLTNPVLRRNLARAHANLGGHLLTTGAPAEAKAAFRGWMRPPSKGSGRSASGGSRAGSGPDLLLFRARPT